MTESLDRPSELFRISSKFHTKEQTHLHFAPPNHNVIPQDHLSAFAAGSHNSIEKINYSSKIGAIYRCLVKV